MWTQLPIDVSQSFEVTKYLLGAQNYVKKYSCISIFNPANNLMKLVVCKGAAIL